MLDYEYIFTEFELLSNAGAQHRALEYGRKIMGRMCALGN